MTRPKFAAIKPTTLRFSISDTETSNIVITRLVDTRGNDVDMTDLGDFGYLTIGPKTDSEEIIKFTGFTRNADNTVTLSGVTRNHLPQSPFTSTGTGSEQGAGTIVVFGNNPQVYEALLDYIDGIAISGSPDASNTSKGLVETATQAEIDADAATGSTGAELAITPDKLASSKYGTQLPSADEKAGIEGLSADNLPVVEDNVTQGSQTVDTQTTATDTFNVGEANTTTNQNKIAQKITATKNSYRGVTLDKDTDTGTFTGTVTISLQADTAGNPSGTPLATVTISNANWLLIAAGLARVTFAAEASTTIGADYWIVIESSTADTSNHPNFGGRTSGGTGNAKYWNTTDGWVQFANSDLYYATHEGNANKVVKTGLGGVIDSSLISTLKSSGVFSKNLADGNGAVTTIAHGLGKIPSRVRLTALNAVSNDSTYSIGVYDQSGQRSLYVYQEEGSSTGLPDLGGADSDYAIRLAIDASTHYQRGFITVDITNIYITWAKSNTPTGTYSVLWEAE